MIKIFLFFLASFGFLSSVSIYASDTLFLKEYLEIVIENHPLIEKANLYDDINEAYLLKAKGVLDPKINSDFQTKNFKDINYFNIWQTKSEIPTRLPIDFSVGFEKNNGEFLNPESFVPNDGLLYGTFNLSILRGLIFDEQRYHIRQAELRGLKSQIEKKILVREVLYQAIHSYLHWSKQYNQMEINRNYQNLIELRHKNIIELHLNGDKPAIDTIESRMNLISSKKKVLDSQEKYIKMSQLLSLFIWDKEKNPMSMTKNVVPMRFASTISDLSQIAFPLIPSFENDPLVKKLDNEIASSILNVKIQREQLKPQLDLQYNTILNLGSEDVNPNLNFNDYKYGVSFQLPILNRKTKGEVKLHETFKKQTELNRTQYIGELKNKYEALLGQRDILDQQLNLIIENIRNSELLLEAEQIKFSLGESSIFLLNQRERKLLESNTDLVLANTKLAEILTEIYYLKLGQN